MINLHDPIYSSAHVVNFVFTATRYIQNLQHDNTMMTKDRQELLISMAATNSGRSWKWDHFYIRRTDFKHQLLYWRGWWLIISNEMHSNLPCELNTQSFQKMVLWLVRDEQRLYFSFPLEKKNDNKVWGRQST